MVSRRAIGWLIALGVLAALVTAGIFVYSLLHRDRPEVHSNILEHFKYGSIGSEARAGVPYSLWLALPRVFADLLPKGEGKGYERFGFIYEPGRRRPIGTSFREQPLGQQGLNCAACHTAMVRASPNARPRVVLGMPANQLNLQAYVKFLRDAGRDARFNPDMLIPAIRRADPDFSRTDELLYRHYVIPRTRSALQQLDDDFAWMDHRPKTGPGRVDTFNPYKVIFNILGGDTTVGTADLPSLWNQRPRRGMQLHWDGNNDKVEERNISAAIGAGVRFRPASKESLDEPSLARLADWILDLPPPRYPRERIQQAKMGRGASLFSDKCSACHSFRGARVGRVTAIDEIRTDRERLDSFTAELSGKMNTLGTGRPWRFSNFRKTNGYANQPLDGIWLRAPYLHNGSVPDLASLLAPPNERPKVFYRGYDVYDWRRVGFVSQGREAARVGFRYDTGVRGNGNGGHVYGTRLSERDKQALIEYMKAL